MIRVFLIGENGEGHASGMVSKEKIVNTHLIVHNKRYYYFKKITPEFYLHFEECEQPYIITEF